MKPSPDALASIRQALGVLTAPNPNPVVELRIIGGRVHSGFFSDLDLAAKEAAQLNGTSSVYQTLNPVDPSLLARAVNRIIIVGRNPTTSDKDILQYLWLPLDFDAKRASGISSTDAEHEAAIAKARDVQAYLRSLGWPDPVFADSGNGGHALYRIDLPNNFETTVLVKRCLQALSLLFTDDVVKVDEGVFNPGRIWKTYGTVACKGDDTKERPHRQSKLLHVPDELKVVSLDKLRALADLVPKPVKSDTKRSGKQFDLDQWISNHELKVVGPIDWNGGHKWIFHECPWNPAHIRKAYIVRFPSGGIGAGCQKESCKGDWASLREIYEPSYRKGRKEPREKPGKGNGKAVAGYGLEGIAEFGEDRLAAKFTELHGEDWRYVDKWGKWVMWTLSRWLVDDTRAALHLVRLVCRDAASSADDARAANKLATRNTVSGVESLARGDRRHAMTSDNWDKDPYLLNALKGTVELRTGALREHRRGDYITKIAAATPQGECPGWMTFLDEITAEDEEYQEYLQRMAGYMLTGDISEHALFFGHGPGGNGKSVFAGVLAAIMGDYATTAPMDMFMEKKGESHPTELAGLRGARLVLCTETEKGRRWAEAKIKALTGGDRISARFMRQDFFEYTPQFKLLVIGNHRPYIHSVNEAIRRRLHLLPFTVSIPTARRDKKIQEKLLLEKDGILAWAFEGCLKWQLGGLNPPKCVVDATEEYFQEEDAVAQFLDEECEQISGAKVAIKDLFTRWKDRAESRGEYVGSSKGLAGELVTHGFKRCRLHGGVKGLEGLRLKPLTS